MQDRPTRAELAVGLAATLSEPGEGGDRAARFRSRVGAGVAAILARELAAGEAPVAAEGARLAELLRKAAPSSEAGVRELQRELAAEIRAGRFDDRLDVAIAALRQGLAERLAISHPGWTEVADDGRG